MEILKTLESVRYSQTPKVIQFYKLGDSNTFVNGVIYFKRHPSKTYAANMLVNWLRKLSSFEIAKSLSVIVFDTIHNTGKSELEVVLELKQLIKSVSDSKLTTIDHLFSKYEKIQNIAYFGIPWIVDNLVYPIENYKKKCFFETALFFLTEQGSRLMSNFGQSEKVDYSFYCFNKPKVDDVKFANGLNEEIFHIAVDNFCIKNSKNETSCDNLNVKSAKVKKDMPLFKINETLFIQFFDFLILNEQILTTSTSHDFLSFFKSLSKENIESRCPAFQIQFNGQLRLKDIGRYIRILVEQKVVLCYAKKDICMVFSKLSYERKLNENTLCNCLSNPKLFEPTNWDGSMELFNDLRNLISQ